METAPTRLKSTIRPHMEPEGLVHARYPAWPPCVATGFENTCARQSSSKGAPKSRKGCEAVQRERLRHAQLLLVISLKFPAHVPLKFVSKLLQKKVYKLSAKFFLDMFVYPQMGLVEIHFWVQVELLSVFPQRSFYISFQDEAFRSPYPV